MSGIKRGRDILLLGAVLVGMTWACGCSKSDLKFRPKVGEARSVRISSNGTSTVSFMGNNMNEPSSGTFGFTWMVDSVDPSGLVTAKVTLDQVDFGQIAGISKLMEGAGGLGGDLGFAGKSFTIKVASNGRVQEIQGMSAIVDEAAKKLTDLMTKQMEKMQADAKMPMPPAMAGKMAGALSGVMQRVFGDSAMREIVEDLMTMYPETPVRVGAEWTRGVIRSFGMTPMTRKEVWKLKSRKNGVATLEVTTDITPNPDATGLDIGMGTIKMDCTGKASGTVDVDEATGWIVKGTMKHDLDGTAKISLTGLGMPGEQSMTMKIRSDGDDRVVAEVARRLAKHVLFER